MPRLDLVPGSAVAAFDCYEGLASDEAGGLTHPSAVLQAAHKREVWEQQQQLSLLSAHTPGALRQTYRLWSTYMGTSPDSPRLCKAVLVLCVGVMASYHIAKSVKELTNSPHLPIHVDQGGGTLPSLSFSNHHLRGNAFSELIEDRPDTSSVTTIRSLAAQKDFFADIRSERICGAEDGMPKDFDLFQFTLQNCDVTALRFPHAGIRKIADVQDAHLTMEMFGEPELFPYARSEATTTLRVRIHADIDHNSRALRTGKPDADRRMDDITTRQLSHAYVQWEVPAQVPHALVQTPDLSSVISELQNITEWNDESTLTLVFIPVPVKGNARRVFKMDEARTRADVLSSETLVLLLQYTMMIPMILRQLWGTQLFQLSLTLTADTGQACHNNAATTSLRYVDPENAYIQPDPVGIRQRQCGSNTFVSLGGSVLAVLLMCLANAYLRSVGSSGQSFFSEAMAELNVDAHLAGSADMILGIASVLTSQIPIVWLSAFILSCEHAAGAIVYAVEKLINPHAALLKMLLHESSTEHSEEDMQSMPFRELQQEAKRLRLRTDLVGWSSVPQSVRLVKQQGSTFFYNDGRDDDSSVEVGGALSRSSNDSSDTRGLPDWEEFSRSRWVQYISNIEHISSHGCFRNELVQVVIGAVFLFYTYRGPNT